MKSKKKKSLRQLKEICNRVFSEYIRRRGADAGGTEFCFTCEKPFYWKSLQCGHAIPGRHFAVLWDEEICRPQCPRCNVFLGGRYEIFTTKLIKERGLPWWEAKLEGAKRIVKYTGADVEALIELYKQKLEACTTQQFSS